MKKTIIILFLMCTVCFAQSSISKVSIKKETLIFVMSPSGGNCKHIHIKDGEGNILVVTNEYKIKKPITERDSLLIKQVKQIIIDEKLEKASLSEMKVVLDAKVLMREVKE